MCNCNKITTTTQNHICKPACPPQEDCTCPVRLNSECLTYNGNDLECSGIESGLPLNQTLELLDTYVCEAIAEINSSINLINVGTGEDIYAGIDGIGRRKIKRVNTDSNILTITPNTDDITFGIDEEALNTFIEENKKTYSVANVGTDPLRVNVYKDSTTVGDNTQFNFRTLTSTGNSVTITQGVDTINLEVDTEPAIICLTSKDKTVTITEVEDCFDLSVNLPTSVNVGTGEDVYKTFNLFTNQNEFKTLKSNNNTINLSPSTDELSLDVNNLQKTISTFPYTLTSSDDKYTIFIANGFSNVVINVPDGLVNNFSAVFIQEGTGTVTIQQSGISTLLYPSTTLQNRIKGQYYWAMVEKKLATNTYYLLGSLLSV